MHIGNYFPSLVAKGDQIFVFDGVKEPEAYGAQVPPFNYPDPSFTTTTSTTTTTTTTTLPPATQPPATPAPTPPPPPPTPPPTPTQRRPRPAQAGGVGFLPRRPDTGRSQTQPPTSCCHYQSLRLVLRSAVAPHPDLCFADLPDRAPPVLVNGLLLQEHH